MSTTVPTPHHRHHDELVGTSPRSSILSTTLSNSNTSFDERQIAKAALDSAEEQLQSLCASHSGTFVSVERRGRTIVSTLNALTNACDNIINNEALICQRRLEQNDEEVENVGDERNGNSTSSEQRLPSLSILSERHRVRRRTLLQHASLIELLELPSLMDACIRSNLYEEAIQIASFGNTLERRHNVMTSMASGGINSVSSDSFNMQGGNSVVAQVVSQIRSRQNDFRRHLLHRLKSYVTMPDCLEIVTSLRRLDSIDLERITVANPSEADKAALPVDKEKMHVAMEQKLQIDFLEARDFWIDTIVPTVVSGSSSITFNSSPPQPSSMVALPQPQEVFSDTIERYRTR
jgi:conserved oligomeric Golgi complex subunit 8